MPRGAHFQTRGDFSDERWRADCAVLLKSLRMKAPVLFIAHDEEEAAFMRGMLEPGERVATATDWRGYLDLYSSCAVVLANRVHGAVCAAGFGVPAVIMGTDTRAGIGDYIAIPRFQSGVSDMAEIAVTVTRMFDRRDDEHRRLISLRNESLKKTARLISRAMRKAGMGKGSDPASFTFKDRFSALFQG